MPILSYRIEARWLLPPRFSLRPESFVASLRTGGNQDLAGVGSSQPEAKLQLDATNQLRLKNPHARRCPSREPIGLADCKVRGLDALDAGLGGISPGLCERAIGIDAATGVLDDIYLEARLARVHRGPGDAKVRGEPDNEHTLGFYYKVR